MRPWSDRAAALLATEGDYADFAAWQEWLETTATHNVDRQVMSGMLTADQVRLYAVMCDLADGVFVQPDAVVECH